MRVVLWNVHSARGIDGIISVERIASELAALKPDIVGLNEVRSWTRVNTAKILGRHLGMTAALQRNVVRLDCRFGNAMLVRGDLLGFENVGLPASLEPRGLLLTRVDTGEGPMVFGVTHLGLGRSERAAQKRRMFEAISQSEPTILVGDMNERPSDFGTIPTGMHLVSPIATYPAADPIVEIDLAFHSDHWAVDDVFTVPTIASDHMPLVVDFRRES